MQPCCCTIIFVLGPPGSGKGTLCKLVAENPDSSNIRYRHLSVGDCLRELRDAKAVCEAGGLDHAKIRDYLREGKLLPADVLVPVLEHKIFSTLDGSSATTTWLIDGFPRNIETALAFEEKFGRPMKLITLDCSRETAQSRFLYRGREKSDDEERFAQRYNEYVENTKPVREHYGRITETIDVDGSREECLGKFVYALS